MDDMMGLGEGQAGGASSPADDIWYRVFTYLSSLACCLLLPLPAPSFLR
jgi:hypothetical protein